jgi:hypothetical protein
MTVRATIARVATRARLTAIGCCTVTILGTAAVSACTSSKPHSLPTVGVTSTILANGSPSPTAFYSGTARVSPTTSSPSPTHSPSPSPSPVTTSPSPTTPPPATQSPTPTQFPTGAPPTGGGGTAGLQYGVLFALGGAAIAGGGWSIAYRRRILKGRR